MISLSYKFGSGPRVLHALSPTVTRNFLASMSARAGGWLWSLLNLGITLSLVYAGPGQSFWAHFHTSSASLPCFLVLMTYLYLCSLLLLVHLSWSYLKPSVGIADRILLQRLVLCLFSTGYSLKTNVSLCRRWWSVTKVCIRVVCRIAVG
jgi:hypothetical protein